MTQALSPPTTPRERAMVAEMEAHLAAITRAAGGSLERELQALYLLAVEREELAVVGYGGADVQGRIARLGARVEVRAIVAHALRWAARDERTHAVLARGLLSGLRRLRLRLQALAADVGGLVAGWSAAVLQHTTRRSAPFSRLVARTVALLGALAGKVPRTARAALQQQSFTAFCAFQVGAELTAALSWERISSLAAQVNDMRVSRTTARIASDERKHERVLRVLLAAFDEHDRLRPGLEAIDLARQLEAIDPAFVPGHARALPSPLGQGGAVHVAEDPRAARGDAAAARQLLRAVLVDTGLLDRLFAGAPPNPAVAVKTTFMMAYDARDPSPVVDPALLEELALLLRARGASRVSYLEAPNHYDRFFGGRSVAEVARYLGFESPHYEVVDCSAAQSPHDFARGHAQTTVSTHWKGADLRLVLAKMRTNPSWLVTLTMAGLDSLGRRTDELLFEDRQGDLVSGLMMLLDAFPPHLAVLDATHHVPDGLTGILGDPDPSHPGRVYAARDALALDLVAARHMGIRHLPGSSALSFALDWFDDPRSVTVVQGPDAPLHPFKSPHRNDATIFLSSLAYPVYVAGGDKGSLWLPLMDTQAFPMLERGSLLTRAVRASLRAVFGFGKPPRP
ncbi:MAG: DUF362 domain-containing protein [Myxococcaceae bacterium]|nr:DUF362 domain-containing protein [Myxococcaceae bacterium]